MPRKRGRPPKYVHDRSGRPLVGLSLDGASGRYYATHADPRVYFGRDFDLAVIRFRDWQGREEPARTVAIPLDSVPLGGKVRLPPLPEAELPPTDPIKFRKWAAGRRPQQFVMPLPTPGHETSVVLDRAKLYAWAAQEIRNDPRGFSESVGIPQIAWLKDVRPPEPSPTLKEIGDAYFGKKRKICAQWRRRQLRYWQAFSDAVGDRELPDLQSEHVKAYHDWVWSRADEEKFSPTFIRHRLQAVRTILRHALKQERNQAQLRRLIDLTEIFELPPKQTTNPCPMAPGDFHKLLEVSSPKWQAILLLALNAALYPSEVAAVLRTEVNLGAKTLRMRRRKTGVARVAVLWDRTVAAIQAYHAEEPHQSDHLFVNAAGSPYDANQLGRNFRRRCKDAGLPSSVTFEQIRDGAYTEAVEGRCGLTQAKVLAGHAAGISDHYILRRPELVRRTCAAIEKAYFGTRADEGIQAPNGAAPS